MKIPAQKTTFAKIPTLFKSALSRYSAQDFIDLVDRHGLQYHHKTLGQLFCDNSAQDLVEYIDDRMRLGGRTARVTQ